MTYRIIAKTFESGLTDIKLNLWNPAGTQVLTNTAMTELGTSGIYYYDYTVASDGWHAGHATSAAWARSESVVFNNLSEVTTSPTGTLRYFTTDDFLSYFNMQADTTDTENGIATSHISLVGEMVEKAIDKDCNTVFDSNSGNYYTETDEYIDTWRGQDSYYTKYRPIYSVTSLSTTTTSEGTDPTWNTVSAQTYYYDLDKTLGRVTILYSSYKTITRKGGLKITYKYGLASTPADIKDLAILFTGVRLFGGTFIRQRLGLKGDANMPETQYFHNLWRETIWQNRYTSIGTL